MSLFWSTILPAILAGGIAGQLVTMFGGSWLAERREQKKWRISERYKLFSELLTITTRIPKSEDDRNNWTYSIRDTSQRLHVLYEGGTAPCDLASAIESVFQLAREKKDAQMSDDWSEMQRNAVRKMREAMAKNLTPK